MHLTWKKKKKKRAHRALGLAAFELQSGNSHLGRAVLVLHGIGRREGVLGRAGPHGSARLLSPARPQLAQVPDHVVPPPAASPPCRDLLCSSAHIASSFAAHLLLGRFLSPCPCLSGDFSLLPQRWHILFLFNGIDFSEGSDLFFQLDVSSPVVPCLWSLVNIQYLLVNTIGCSPGVGKCFGLLASPRT